MCLDAYNTLLRPRDSCNTLDSSVGRAVDCSRQYEADIHRSLVQLRLEGFFFSCQVNFPTSILISPLLSQAPLFLSCLLGPSQKRKP